MMENAERRGLLDEGAPAAVGDACAGAGPDSSVAASATAPAGIEAARSSSSRSPRSGTGASKMRNMVLAALMPFMAVWNSEPRRRMGKKNSCDRNTTKKAPEKPMAPGASCSTATAMPAAAPPKATRSITLMELSCTRSIFMVARRKPSDSSFIRLCQRSSA